MHETHERGQAVTNWRDHAVEVFFKAWIPELGRSIEMFHGEQPGLAWTPLKGDRANQTFSAADEVLWWRQELECNGDFSVWIGAPKQTWQGLTDGLAETSEDRWKMFLEMLGPSLQGLAHALSATTGARMVCKDGSLVGNAPDASFAGGAVTLTMNGRTLPPIVASLEPSFVSRIAPQEPENSDTGAADPGNESRLRFERLIELELPISIVLGRAVLPIRDVLKLSAGSLVDLDRRVGDPVEIVVHNMVVARGEVVAVRGNYGVRVKEVISRKDRMALQASAGTEAMSAPGR